jgi:glycosyltransferase involved in cell wall biosynthesis
VGEKIKVNGHQLTLSVVIPALNEEDGITDIMGRVLGVRPALKDVGVGDLELIVVDDGSRDKTPQIVASTPDVRLVRHRVNRGYGAALKTGFNAASGELLAFLDADGTYPPEYFPQLCQAAIDGADVVVGSRRSGAKSEMPAVRRLGNMIWSNLLSVIAGQRVMDPASGMRVFRQEALTQLYPLPDGLNFTPVMSTRSAHEGMQVVEIPIPYKERLGRSKLNVVKDGMRFLRTILWTALNYNPVRILGGIGLALVAFTLFIGFIIVGMRFSGITSLGPLGVAATFSAVVAGVTGVNLFALGVTFNYLVSLFHKKPVRQGLFGKPLLKTPLENHFWWIGLLMVAAGAAIGVVSFFLALQGWPVTRLWLYLLGGSMLTLLGIQLFIFWIIVQVLAELSQRDEMVEQDLAGG